MGRRRSQIRMCWPWSFCCSQVYSLKVSCPEYCVVSFLNIMRFLLAPGSSLPSSLWLGVLLSFGTFSSTPSSPANLLKKHSVWSARPLIKMWNNIIPESTLLCSTCYWLPAGCWTVHYCPLSLVIQLIFSLFKPIHPACTFLKHRKCFAIRCQKLHSRYFTTAAFHYSTYSGWWDSAQSRSQIWLSQWRRNHC